jgi:hypothetical protein
VCCSRYKTYTAPKSITSDIPLEDGSEVRAEIRSFLATRDTSCSWCIGCLCSRRGKPFCLGDLPSFLSKGEQHTHQPCMLSLYFAYRNRVSSDQGASQTGRTITGMLLQHNFLQLPGLGRCF